MNPITEHQERLFHETVKNQDVNPLQVVFSPDGKKAYMLGSKNVNIFQYSTPIPWVIDDLQYDHISFSVLYQDVNPICMQFKPDGTKLYVLGATNLAIFQYSLSIPWKLQLAEYEHTYCSILDYTVTPKTFEFDNEGKVITITDREDVEFKHRLNEPWELVI